MILNLEEVYKKSQEYNKKRQAILNNCSKLKNNSIAKLDSNYTYEELKSMNEVNKLLGRVKTKVEILQKAIILSLIFSIPAPICIAIIWRGNLPTFLVVLCPMFIFVVSFYNLFRKIVIEEMKIYVKASKIVDVEEYRKLNNR